jgi:hypothetical protein
VCVKKTSVSDTEIEGEESDTHTILKLSEQYLKLTGKKMSTEFIGLLSSRIRYGYDPSLLWECITRAIDKDKPYPYAKAILNAWDANYIKSLKDLEVKENLGMGSKTGARAKKPTHENFDQREYKEDDLEKFYVNVNE